MKYIFLHGLGQTAQSWQEVICQLDPEWDVLCIDLGGMALGKEAVTAHYIRNWKSTAGSLKSLCACVGFRWEEFWRWILQPIIRIGFAVLC